jgi:hypothetical protein
MSEPLSLVIESSLQIAWDFLMASGEIANPQQSAEFLLESIRTRALRGEARPLMLANRAIDAYREQAIAA